MTDLFISRSAPPFTRPGSTPQTATSHKPICFVGAERETLLASCHDRLALELLFSEDQVSDLSYDDQGNEYGLEVCVRRVRIINSQNG